MIKKSLVSLACLVGCTSLFAQQATVSTDLPGQPYFLKKTWMIGGVGNWDFITVDPSYPKLYVAHGRVVQVVDIETGTVEGEIGGLWDARAIALDDRGEFGFISDAGTNKVLIFNRQTLSVLAKIQVPLNPRSLVFDPSTGLVFVVCGQPPGSLPADRRRSPEASGAEWERNAVEGINQAGSYTVRKPAPAPSRFPAPSRAKEPPPESVIAILDPEKHIVVANLLLRGRAGFAQTDGGGRIFINIVNQNSLLRLDAVKLKALWQSEPAPTPAPKPIVASSDKLPAASVVARMDSSTSQSSAVSLDWRNFSPESPFPEDVAHFYALNRSCSEPQGLTIDARHLRLFVACSNRQIQALNIDTGEVIAKLPTSSGTGVIEYDPNQALIFAASGDEGGTLTIIQQTVTDNYRVVQNLRTCFRARVMAVNRSSGEVYLVTDAGQEDMSDGKGLQAPPPKGPGPSSFHVLVVGH